MAHFGSPAHSAAMGNLPGMMMIGAGAVGLMNAINAGCDAIRDARSSRAHNDALGAATAHADGMEDLARTAVGMVAELEADVASLRVACCQRQQVINVLAARGRV
ncbi:hypothetical protein [Shinella sp.]|uniref:hypothetical protein n=1 Tax=Shinella sp. TaxID=1870904 RepID=UPI0029B0E969|nr:hypothetical protein [Shinella sp.]MDX3975765.1 hypothetical protein [Shinella sp.]